MPEKLPVIILFAVAAALFAFSLVLNKKLKALIKADREAQADLPDPEKPVGDTPECKNLRIYIYLLDFGAIVLMIVGFLI